MPDQLRELQLTSDQLCIILGAIAFKAWDINNSIEELKRKKKTNSNTQKIYNELIDLHEKLAELTLLQHDLIATGENT